MILNPSIEN